MIELTLSSCVIFSRFFAHPPLPAKYSTVSRTLSSVWRDACCFFPLVFVCERYENETIPGLSVTATGKRYGPRAFHILVIGTQLRHRLTHSAQWL